MTYTDHLQVWDKVTKKRLSKEVVNYTRAIPVVFY